MKKTTREYGKRNRLRGMIIGGLVSLLCALGFASAEQVSAAQEYLQLYFDNDWAAAVVLQDATMKGAFGTAAMQGSFVSLSAQYGDFLEIVSLREEDKDQYVDVVFLTRWQNGFLDFHVVMNAQNQVSGFRALPAQDPADQGAAYVNPQAFTELEIQVGEEPWLLDAYLTVPNNLSEFPLVVLLGGSGPTDRDATIGPNKIFRDIAQGLSSQGIAVLRYDKRAFAHGEQLLQQGPSEDGYVADEYLSDAMVVLEQAAAIQGVNEIILAGHSLGGAIAPTIALRSEFVDRLILLAASARRFGQVSMDQNEYFAPVSGITDEQLAQVKAFFQAVLDHQLPADTVVQPGLTVEYYYDWDRYPTIETLEKLSIPVLVLQGEQDFQSTMEGDFLPLKQALVDNVNFTFESFPRLNHLFLETEVGVFHTTDEYAIPGHVSEELIIALVEWIS